MKYVSKPETIEAFKWTGDPALTGDPIWAINALQRGRIKIEKVCGVYRMLIMASRGYYTASPGDYIVCKGKSIYPIYQHEFEEKYEEVAEEELVCKHRYPSGKVL